MRKAVANKAKQLRIVVGKAPRKIAEKRGKTIAQKVVRIKKPKLIEQAKRTLKRAKYIEKHSAAASRAVRRYKPGSKSTAQTV